MERVVRKFRSHAEAEAADREYYRNLTPKQRVDILLDLMNLARDPANEAHQRLARVYRIVPLKRS